MNSPHAQDDFVVVTGPFDVQLGAPAPLTVPEGGTSVASRSLDKSFHGALSGRALGQMLFAGKPQEGEAVYVAMDSFVGTLDGRSGSFALAHMGEMHAGAQTLRVCVVPGSSQGELAGLEGELSIRIENGKHFYTLKYRFA